MFHRPHYDASYASQKNTFASFASFASLGIALRCFPQQPEPPRGLSQPKRVCTCSGGELDTSCSHGHCRQHMCGCECHRILGSSYWESDSETDTDIDLEQTQPNPQRTMTQPVWQCHHFQSIIWKLHLVVRRWEWIPGRVRAPIGDMVC